MKSSVLDSYAVLAFLFQESGHQKVVALFERAAESDKALLIAAPNWAEVRYMIERKVGLAQWREASARLLGLPIEITPVDQELAEMAGEIKATKKMSLADCFAAALAKQRKIDLYTGDPEFRLLETELKIIWL
ncbi:MAG: type II toxin-antitoxin system VapC family toxin [Nitrospiraceae bacterium]